MELNPKRSLRDLATFRKELDNLWNRFFGESAIPRPVSGKWAPPVDVSETEEEIRVKGELPGLNAADIEVRVSGDTLTIRGEKKEQTEEGEAYFHRETHTGDFERSVRLPAEVDVDNVEAQVKDGLLKIRLPKTRTSAAKKVEVKPA